MPAPARRLAPARRFDVAVVGGGPAGLAAAASAALAGCRVALVDAGRAPGRPVLAPRRGLDRRAGHRDWSVFAGLRSLVEERVEHLPGRAVWFVEPGFVLHTSAGPVEARPARPRHRRLRPRAAVPGLGPARRGDPGRGAGPAQGLRRGGGPARGRGRGRPVPAAGGRRACSTPGSGWSACTRPATRAAYLRRPGALAGGGRQGGGGGRVRGRAGPPPRPVPHAAARSWPPTATARCPKWTSPGSTGPAGRARYRAGGVRRGRRRVRLHGEPGAGPRARLPDRPRPPTAAWPSASARTGVRRCRACSPPARSPGSAAPRWPSSRASSPGPPRAAAVGAEPLPAGTWRRCGAARTGCGRSPRRCTPPTRRRPAGRRGWPTTRWCAGARRCPHGAVARAVELGGTDARTVRSLARPGMGWCQGRVCGYATAELTARSCGRAGDRGRPAAFAARPFAAPVRLGDLAADACRHDGYSRAGATPGRGPR